MYLLYLTCPISFSYLFPILASTLCRIAPSSPSSSFLHVSHLLLVHWSVALIPNFQTYHNSYYAWLHTGLCARLSNPFDTRFFNIIACRYSGCEFLVLFSPTTIFNLSWHFCTLLRLVDGAITKLVTITPFFFSKNKLLFIKVFALQQYGYLFSGSITFVAFFRRFPFLFPVYMLAHTVSSEPLLPL